MIHFQKGFKFFFYALPIFVIFQLFPYGHIDWERLGLVAIGLGVGGLYVGLDSALENSKVYHQIKILIAAIYLSGVVIFSLSDLYRYLQQGTEIWEGSVLIMTLIMNAMWPIHYHLGRIDLMEATHWISWTAYFLTQVVGAFIGSWYIQRKGLLFSANQQ